MGNVVSLAVAGSRKTQGIIDHCVNVADDRRPLVVTYTTNNQTEIRNRLKQRGVHPARIPVLGWFTFLLRHFARPFIPFIFPGERVLGFNFEGVPSRFAKGRDRFLDRSGFAYSSELSRLAHELVEASNGALIRRLECIYDEIHIDEVQDLSGYDWNILDALLASHLDVSMVGDMRQAVLATNPRSRKNKRYAYAEAVAWFREREERGELKVVEDNRTWRCHPDVAAFSDTIFEASWAFPRTESLNYTTTDHDGVYLVRPKHVADYVRRWQPQCLRHAVNSGKEYQLAFVNFGAAKGMAFRRVLIAPTAGIMAFLQRGQSLNPVPAARFYVAVTRASQSVAIILDDPETSTLPVWTPEPG